MSDLIDINGDLKCPLDCDKPLRLIWSMAQWLAFDADSGIVSPALFSDPALQEWKIECEDGHVILLPGPGYCEEDDDLTESCSHDNGHDYSDEFRTFRVSDAKRLLDLLKRVRALKVTIDDE